MQIYRRDILIIDMKQTPVTSLQTRIRPVLVISNNKANTYRPVLIVAPINSNGNQRGGER